MAEVLIGVTRLAISGFYDTLLGDGIKSWWDKRKILKRIMERIEELCDARVGIEFSEVLQKMGMPEDLIEEQLKEEKKKIKQYKSITLWMEHIAHLKSFITNLFKLYEIELSQLYGRKLSDKARKLLEIDIPNQVEDVLLELKPNKITIQTFKIVRDTEKQLNKFIETASNQENYQQLENLFDQVKNLYETLFNSQGTALQEIKELKIQLQAFQTSKLQENIFEIKTLFRTGFMQIYNVLIEISDRSPESLLTTILEHISNEMRKLSNELGLIREQITGISSSRRDTSSQQSQILYDTCEKCNKKFPNDFITVLRNEGQYICPKCGAIFPGLATFLSGTRKEKYIYEHVNEKLEKCGYKISWYLDEFRVMSNNVLDDCFQNLKKSDRVILVIGKDYGSEYEDSGHSVTEEEWIQALRQEKRILIFVESDVYEEYKRLDRMFEPEYDLRIHEFIQAIEEKRKNWVFTFDRSEDIANKVLTSWGCFVGGKERSILESEPKELPKSNYDNIMMTNIKEPKYFRKLETVSLGGVFHVDIEREKVMRIPDLIENVKENLFTRERWVLLSGSSGLSKTTSAKIIAHDARKEHLSVIFCNDVNQISKFAELVANSDEEWLLIIDDLHRTEHGEISEKLSSLNSIAQIKSNKVHVLSTSRLSLDHVKKSCKNEKSPKKIKITALHIAEMFEEIKLEDYGTQLNQAKSKLINSILKDIDFPNTKLNETRTILLERYSSNFVLLGFATLPLIEGKSKEITNQAIFSRIKDLLQDEFEDILEEQKVEEQKEPNPIILLQAFIGICYESTFDEAVSINDFHHEKHNDFIKTFKRLTKQGLVLESENWVKNEKGETKLIYMYRTHHARIAEIYIKTLKAVIDSFRIRGEIFTWKNLCVLSRFKAHVKSGLGISEIIKDFNRLISLNLTGLSLENLPPSIVKLEFLKELNLHGNKLSTLPVSI